MDPRRPGHRMTRATASVNPWQGAFPSPPPNETRTCALIVFGGHGFLHLERLALQQRTQFRQTQQRDAIVRRRRHFADRRGRGIVNHNNILGVVFERRDLQGRLCGLDVHRHRGARTRCRGADRRQDRQLGQRLDFLRRHLKSVADGIREATNADAELHHVRRQGQDACFDGDGTLRQSAVRRAPARVSCAQTQRPSQSHRPPRGPAPCMSVYRHTPGAGS